MPTSSGTMIWIAAKVICRSHFTMARDLCMHYLPCFSFVLCLSFWLILHRKACFSLHMFNILLGKDLLLFISKLPVLSSSGWVHRLPEVLSLLQNTHIWNNYASQLQFLQEFLLLSWPLTLTPGFCSPYTATDSLLSWPILSRSQHKFYKCSILRSTPQRRKSCYRTQRRSVVYKSLRENPATALHWFKCPP